MTISLNVVVWDESNVIDRCLKSARHYVDEILILADSGCRFVDRLEKYTHKIIIDDLSGTIVEHHRNTLIEESKGEWILTLDPDEWLYPNLGSKLQSLKLPTLDGWWLPRYNIIYTEDYELAVGEDYPDWNLRFYRNHARYSGTIYEDSFTLGTIKPPLGLKRLDFCPQGMLIHDKTYEDYEEVQRTLRLYNRWEHGNSSGYNHGIR